MKDAIDRQTDEEALEYLPLLAKLGMSETQAASTLDRIKRIHEASSLVSFSLIELSTARVQHDRIMRTTLSGDAYARYVDHERSKPIREEVRGIEALLQKSGMSLGEHLPAVETAIRQFQATTTEFSDGPYDGVPHPTANPSDLVPFRTSELDRLEKARKGLVASLHGAIPENLVAQVDNYFSLRVAEFQQRLRNVSMPQDHQPIDPVEEIERFRKQVQLSPSP